MNCSGSSADGRVRTQVEAECSRSTGEARGQEAVGAASHLPGASRARCGVSAGAPHAQRATSTPTTNHC